MQFNKKNQKEQAEAMPIASMSASSGSQKQSLFAPGLNPTPAHIDFGFGQVYEPQQSASAAANPAPPAEPIPDWASNPSPSTDSFNPPPEQSWANDPQPSPTEASSLPMSAADTLTEPAWPTADSNSLPDMPAASWEEAPQSIPEPTQPYLTETFDHYTAQPATEPNAPELPAWEPASPVEPTQPESWDPTPEAAFAPVPTEDFQANNIQSQWDSPVADLPTPGNGLFSETPMPAAATPEPVLIQPPTESASSFPNEDPFMQGMPYTDPAEPLGWHNLNTPEIASSSESPIPMEPGAFLDSVNQQLYPQDPFSSGNSELDESAQAFEDAAQFLFPETMGAPLDWSIEDTDTSFDNTPALLGNDTVFEPILELGPSFQTETAGFDDISVFEAEPNQFNHFEPTGINMSAAGLNFSPPPEEPAWDAEDNTFSFSSDDELAGRLPATFADEAANSDALSFASEPNAAFDPSMGNHPSAQPEPDFEFGSSFEGGIAGGGIPTYELPGQPIATWDDALLSEPLPSEDITQFDSGTTWSPADEPEVATFNLPPTNLSNQQEVVTSGMVGREPQLAQPNVNPTSPSASPSDEEFYAVSFTLDEQGELIPDHGEATTQPMGETGFSSPGQMPGAGIYTPGDLESDSFSQPTPVFEAIPLYYQEPSASQASITPSLGQNRLETVSEESISAFEFLNEPQTSEAAFEEEVPTYSFEMPTAATSLPPLPDVLSEEAAPPTHYLSMPESALLPPFSEPEPAARQAVTDSPTAFQSAPHEEPLPPVTAPFTAAAGFSTAALKPQAPQAASHTLENQWEHAQQIESQPIPKKAAQPQASDFMMSGDLEILSICPLDTEKRLLLIQNSGVFALMGQCGAEQPQISVLKVFENNPIAYQNTFTAVAEGQAGNQGMYVVQVGTWHAIISTFQNNITLHTELG